MRAVRLSRTFSDQLADYLDAGELRYGRVVADEKRRLVFNTIQNIVAVAPGMKARHGDLGLVVYPITNTPFFIVYDYDDDEVRVLLIFIGGKSIDAIDVSTVEW